MDRLSKLPIALLSGISCVVFSNWLLLVPRFLAIIPQVLHQKFPRSDKKLCVAPRSMRTTTSSPAISPFHLRVFGLVVPKIEFKQIPDKIVFSGVSSVGSSSNFGGDSSSRASSSWINSTLSSFFLQRCPGFHFSSHR